MLDGASFEKIEFKINRASRDRPPLKSRMLCLKGFSYSYHRFLSFGQEPDILYEENLLLELDF